MTTCLLNGLTAWANGRTICRLQFTEEFMAVKAIDPAVQQLWIDFKQDQSDQRLRNRLIEQYYQ